MRVRCLESSGRVAVDGEVIGPGAHDGAVDMERVLATGDGQVRSVAGGEEPWDG